MEVQRNQLYQQNPEAPGLVPQKKPARKAIPDFKTVQIK
jgi:hypothetical protein